MRYRSTRKSVYSAKYHVIWCPKYRQRVIGGRVEARLKQIIDEAVTECGGDVIECETMPDHVHLLLELPPTVPLSALMQKMKGRSSRRLWAEFPQLRRLTRVVVTLMVRLDGWWSPARRCPPLRREPAAGQVAQCPLRCRAYAYPTDGQLYGLRTHCAHARFVWNLACEQQSCYRVAGRSSPPPNSTVRFRQLAEARADNDWLASGSSSVQQQALRDFDQAMAVFFAGTHRKPSWREAGRNEGFCVRDVTVRRLNRRWSAVQVPKVGELRFRLSRPLPAKTGMARVSLDRAGRWHVAFTAAQPPVDREPTGSAIGIDRGVATTVALSDGQHRRAPHSGKAERKTCTLNARMSRQHRGSRRRQRTKQSLRG